MKTPFQIYTGEIKDNSLELTKFGYVVAWLSHYLEPFMWWRWFEGKVGFEIYCARCGGCGYVDCCGMKCDRGLFCGNYYEEKECLSVGGFVRCIPWEPVEDFAEVLKEPVD